MGKKGKSKFSSQSGALHKLAQQTGHIPNFVQVDFFEYPNNDIFKVINSLNGVA